MNRLWLVLAPVVLAVVFVGFRVLGDAASGQAAAAPSAQAAAPETALSPVPEQDVSAAERDAALRAATDGDWALDEFRDGLAPGQGGAAESAPTEPGPEAAGTPEVFFTPAESPQEFGVEGAGNSQTQTFGSQFPGEEDDGLSSDTVVRGDAAVRAAFYYPWFPQAWTQGDVFPFTRYHPTLGYYGSSDRDVIRRHIAAM